MGTRIAFVQNWCYDALISRHSSPLRTNACESCRQRNRGASVLKRPPLPRIPSFRMCAQTEEKADVVESSKTKQKLNPPLYVKIERYVTIAAYIGFVTFALFLGPGSYRESGEIQKILSGNVDEVNDLFFSIFNLVGATSITYAAILNPGASRQKRLPTNIFSFLGCFVGFYALGPYLIGREYASQVSREEVEKRGLLSRILESRIFGGILLLYILWIYAYTFGLFTPGSEQLHDAMFYGAAVDLSRLLLSDRVVSTTTMDTVMLSTLLWAPLTEDMRRRGWFRKGQKTESWLAALSILSAPGLGPALYLVLRPRLPGRRRSDIQK